MTTHMSTRDLDEMARTTISNGHDGHESIAASSARQSVGEDAAWTIQHVHDRLKAVRRDLATLYNIAASDSDLDDLEHEIGECLTKVRAAAARVKKAVGEVAQMRLPMQEG